MSKKTIDTLIMRAVSDPEFRARLMDPAKFEEAIRGLDLSAEEIDRLRRTTSEKKAKTLPYAQGLGDRLAK